MKIRSRSISRCAIPAIALIAGFVMNANAQHKNSSGEDDDSGFFDLWNHAFEPVESEDIRFIPKDRLFEVDSMLNRRLLERLEDLATSDGDLLDSPFDFFLEDKSPEDILVEIETRFERSINHILDDYSINSGQNDRLDEAMNNVTDPFFSSLDDFAERTKKLAEGAGELPNHATPNPLISQQSQNSHRANVDSFVWRYFGMSQSSAANSVAIYGLMREIKRRSLNSLYQMKRDLELVDQETPEDKQEFMEAIDQLIAEEEEAIDVIESGFKAAKEAFEEVFGVSFDAPSSPSPTTPDQMPSPDDPGFSEEALIDVIEFLLLNGGNLSFLEKGSHFYGVVMPAPDQREIPNPEEIDRNAGSRSLDPLVDPGTDPVVDPENPEDIPEGLQGPPVIQKFGGTVDPVGPAASKSKNSGSSSNFFTEKD